MGSCQPAPLQPRPSGWLHLSSRHSASPSAGLIIAIRARSGDCHVGRYTHTERNESCGKRKLETQMRKKKKKKRRSRDIESEINQFTARRSACLNISYLLTILFCTAHGIKVLAVIISIHMHRSFNNQRTKTHLISWHILGSSFLLRYCEHMASGWPQIRLQRDKRRAITAEREKKHSWRIRTIMESWPHRYQELRYEKGDVTFRNRPS